MGLKLEEVVGKKLTEAQFDEAAGEKDACYHKVKARYDVWPSAYASGALVKCREVGAKNWGNKSKGKKKEGVNETPQMAKQGQVGLLLKLANKQLQNVSSLHKKGKNKEAKVFFNNKVYSTLEYIHRAFDNVSESVNEGLDEGQKRRASDILRKFDMAYIKFSQEVRDVMKLMDKSTGNKTDSRIINKAYGKHLIPFDDIMQSWARGQQNNPKIDEGPQRNMNNLALYIIDLNNMLSNAKILAKKDPKAKMYIKLLQKDIKDAKKKLAKIKKPIKLKSKSGMGKISHLGMEK